MHEWNKQKATVTLAAACEGSDVGGGGRGFASAVLVEGAAAGLAAGGVGGTGLALVEGRPRELSPTAGFCVVFASTKTKSSCKVTHAVWSEEFRLHTCVALGFCAETRGDCGQRAYQCVCVRVRPTR